MKISRSSLLWGILLVGAGLVALAQRTGLMRQVPEQVWAWVFALVGVVSFASYGLSGWKEWGWLFPAGIFGALAVMVGLLAAGIDNPAVACALFFGLVLPFAAAYLFDRSRNWWALIPGGVMVFLALTVLLVDRVGGQWIGALFLLMIALVFFIVYRNKPTRMWSLLVAYSVAALAIAPAMASDGSLAAYYGGVFLLLAALPFLFIYFRSREAWWPIIPASALIALALITVAAIAGWVNDASSGGLAATVIAAALAVAFAVIWLRHQRPWAKTVTIVLSALAIASALLAAQSAILWPIAVMLAGICVLSTGLRSKLVLRRQESRRR